MFLFCSVGWVGGGTYHGTLLTLPQLANRHVTSPPTALHDGVPLPATTMIVVKPPAESYLDDGTEEAPPVHLSAYLHMIGIGDDPAGNKKKVGAPPVAHLLGDLAGGSWCCLVMLSSSLQLLVLCRAKTVDCLNSHAHARGARSN